MSRPPAKYANHTDGSELFYNGSTITVVYEDVRRTATHFMSRPRIQIEKGNRKAAYGYYTNLVRYRF